MLSQLFKICLVSVFVFVLLFYSHNIFSQEINFSHLSVNDGLSTNFANCICQDKKGFLWIGTENGLQRYDGNSFKSVITLKNPLPKLPVDQLLYDSSRDVIWICMGTRVGRFFPSSGEFLEANISIRLLPNGNLYPSLNIDSKHHILFTIGSAGIFVFDDKKNIFKENAAIILIPENFSIISAYENAERGWFYLCGKEGLKIYDQRTKEIYSPEFNPYHIKELSASKNLTYIQYVFIDDKKRFWLKTWTPFGPQSILLLDTNGVFKNKPIELNTINYSESLGLFKSHHLVFCYGTDVFNMYDENKKKFYKFYTTNNADATISFSVIKQVFEDKEKNLWIVTDNGLYQAIIINNYVINGSIPSFPYSDYIFISPQSYNNVISGSWGQGISIFYYNWPNRTIDYDSSLIKKIYKTRTIDEDPDYYRVWDFLIDSSYNTIYLCCQAGKLIEYNFKTNKSDFLKPDIFTGSTVRQVVKDKEGNHWFGTQSGKIVKEINGKFSLLYDYNKAFISRLFIDSKGLLWVCTSGFGIRVIDIKTNKTIKTFTDEIKPGLSINHSADIVQVNDSMYIASTLNSLNIINNKTNHLFQINSDNGLPGTYIQTITKDLHNVIWISTNAGIASFNPFRKKFHVYDKKDGIGAVYSYSDLFNTSATLQNGDIMLGGTDGKFLIFNPDSVGSRQIPKDIVVTDIRLFNSYLPIDSVAQRGGLNLNHEQNTITINFTSLSYSSTSALTYYYRLLGASNEWIKADKPYSASYASLSPGAYTFQARCVNADGIASEHITSLNINISKAYWQTWWFIALVIIIALIPVYIIYSLRIKRLEAVQKIREKVARDLHDDVGSTLTSINILSEFSKSKVDEESEVKNYLNRISNTSSQMMDAMDDIVWNIKPANDTMTKIEARMREYAAAVFEPKDIAYRFIDNEKIKSVSLNMDVRRSLFLIFKETLNNIAKYANANLVTVQFELKHAQLLVTIIDDGIGFDESKIVYGNGIENMQKRARSFKGVYNIKSYSGKGTHVALYIPLSKYYK